MPEYVWITEKDDIKVGWWDDKAAAWSTEKIEELQYDKTNRILEFNSSRLAPFAYLQSRCTDYPYKGWKLRYVETINKEGEKHVRAIVDVFAKRVDLVFEIGEAYVKLIEREDPEL